jgi:IS30 family transposase
MRYQHLKQEERNEIAILLKKGYSLRNIAHALGRSPSSVSREIKRNSAKRKYVPRKAKHKAYVRRKYSKYQGMKIRENSEIENYVEEKLRLSWSPASISGRMKSDLGISVHHTVIYKYLYGQYGQHLCRYLRYKRYRRSKRMKTKSVREIIKNRVFIDQRPVVINERKRFGDFEGDTLGVPKYTRQTLAGAIERKSRYILARKVSRLKNTMEGFKKMFQSLPALSLTLDNGVENVHYEELEIPTYFCHPYSSWEKGSIENAFGLIREFIPKKSSLKSYSQSDIDAIVEIINGRPRKCLNWRTPKEVFQEQFLNNECCTSG